jgi:hypothetical protein
MSIWVEAQKINFLIYLLKEIKIGLKMTYENLQKSLKFPTLPMIKQQRPFAFVGQHPAPTCFAEIK